MNPYLASCKADVEKYLATCLHQSGKAQRLIEAMNYSLLTDGKRLRPALCLATAETFGVSRDTAMPAAVALEMIHCYSLIHDDLPVMDDDDLRRGKPTNHRVFGEAMALLAGDGLLTEAFVQISRPLVGVTPARHLQMIHLLAERAGATGMVAGQAVDIQMTGTEGDLETLEFIHLNKTAKLIQASIEIGALIPELSSAEFQALSTYGENLGLAFQMVDDILDVVGTADELGKTPGKDADANKLTYPRLIGLEETRRLAELTIERGRQALLDAGIQSEPLASLESLVIQRTK